MKDDDDDDVKEAFPVTTLARYDYVIQSYIHNILRECVFVSETA